MRFHVLGLAHTQTRPEYTASPFTTRAYRMCRMLTELGHEVYHYGAEGSNPVCSENVDVLRRGTQQKVYGELDWHQTPFEYDWQDDAYREFDKNAIKQIRRRAQKGDFLLSSFGSMQRRIIEGVRAGVVPVEFSVGYAGVTAKTHRVFQSYAWMHYVYGVYSYGPEHTSKVLLGALDGEWNDAVIPNFYNLSEFRFSARKEDWYLYLGRVTPRKGITLAAEVTKAIGARLLVAGQGKLVSEKQGLNITDEHVRHVGYAGVKERKELLAGAKAVFCPTYYIEPFGGIAVEAMLSGTPVITTDWGAFSETVLPGVTGFRCRTFNEFVTAARRVSEIDPYDCRDWAVENYSMGRVADMYEAYFVQLSDLLSKNGWYKLSDVDDDWQNRYRRWFPRACNRPL